MGLFTFTKWELSGTPETESATARIHTLRVAVEARDGRRHWWDGVSADPLPAKPTDISSPEYAAWYAEHYGDGDYYDYPGAG